MSVAERKGLRTRPHENSAVLRYSIYQDRRRRWRWRLITMDDEIIADSGEAYERRADCLQYIYLVKATFDVPVYEE